MSRYIKRAIAIVLLIASAIGLAGVQAAGYSDIGQLDGTRIGVQTGTADGEVVEARFPDATVTYYGSATDLATALLKNKIDTFPMSVEVLGTIMRENDRLTYLSEPLYTFDCAFAFGKSESGKALCAEYNSFLRRLEADGTLGELREKWMNGLNHKPVNYDALPDQNGTLRMATDASYAPFEFVSNGRYAGFDIELAALFCEACGYALEIVDMHFDTVIAAVQTGKCDFAGSTIEITEERAQNVLFSEPYHRVRTVMAVRKEEDNAAKDAALPEIRDFSDLRGRTVSMITGAPFVELIRDKVADVGEFTYFNSTPDMLLALKSGKTDAALANCAVASLAVSRNPELTLLPETLMDCVFGFAFAKGDPARDDWQAACDAIPEETKRALWEKWTGSDDSKKTMPAQDWPGRNGTVQVAACDTLEPTCYIGEGGGLMGFDIEMILKMAEIMDVHVEFTGMEFSSVLASVQAGKALFGAGAVFVTEERKESMDFVEYYPAAFVLIVRAAAEATDTKENSWDRIVSSFEKTFLREERWKLFADGVVTTLLITVLSVLFGTVLGFLDFMLCRSGNPVANGITRFCLWLVQGMPMVVLLMVLYYIIFGSVSVSGPLVAVIGFTLTFGATVYGLLKMGVGTVDRGQYEAAFALGYSNRRTFFKVILPQAVPHILPAYKGEIVGLIKATAIVGYIAVQDLTKMGDIVRSRTYEAFFPLIAITVIYFVLEGLIGVAISRVSVKNDPKRRSRASILKGIKTDD